jgi:hypothetical protein
VVSNGGKTFTPKGNSGQIFLAFQKQKASEEKTNFVNAAQYASG